MTDFNYWNNLAAQDGGVFCCICFEFVKFDDAYVDKDGQKWDMCNPCGEFEELAGK